MKKKRKRVMRPTKKPATKRKPPAWFYSMLLAIDSRRQSMQDFATLFPGDLTGDGSRCVSVMLYTSRLSLELAEIEVVKIARGMYPDMKLPIAVEYFYDNSQKESSEKSRDPVA